LEILMGVVAVVLLTACAKRGESFLAKATARQREIAVRMSIGLCAGALALTLPAQSMVPAKAGLVSYADEAYVDDRLVEISPTRFFAMSENAVLRTGIGRAEVLLGPCSAMWVDEQSSLRMISSGLNDVRLEVLSGSLVVATGEMVRGTKVTLLLKTSVAVLDPKGAYRFDAAPPRIKVLAGRTTVQWAGRAIPISAGRLLPLDAAAQPVKFDKQNTDVLETWSDGRAAYLAHLSGQLKREGPEGGALNPTMGRGGLGRNRQPLESIPPTLPNPPGSGCGVTAW
jgi:hypothetical protein